MASELGLLSAFLRGAGKGATMGAYVPFPGAKEGPWGQRSEIAGEYAGSLLPAMFGEGLLARAAPEAFAGLRAIAPELETAARAGAVNAGMSAANQAVRNTQEGQPATQGLGKAALIGGGLGAAFGGGAHALGEAYQAGKLGGLGERAQEGLGIGQYDPTTLSVVKTMDDWLNRQNTVNGRSEFAFKNFLKSEPDPERRAYATMVASNPEKYPPLDESMAQYAKGIRDWLNWAHTEARNAGMDIPYWGDEVNHYIPGIRKSKMNEEPLYEGTGPGARSLRTSTQHTMKKDMAFDALVNKFGEDVIKDPAVYIPLYLRRTLGVAENVRLLNKLRGMAGIVERDGKQFAAPLILPERALGKEDGYNVKGIYEPINVPRQLRFGVFAEGRGPLYAHPALKEFFNRIFVDPTANKVSKVESEWRAVKAGLTGWKFINPWIHGGNVIRAVLAAYPGVENLPHAILTAGKLLGAGAKSTGRGIMAAVTGSRPNPVDLFEHYGLGLIDDANMHGLRLSGANSWEIQNTLENEMQLNGPPSTWLGKLSEKSEKMLEPMHRALWEGIVRNAQLSLYTDMWPRFERDLIARGAQGNTEEAAKKLAAEFVNNLLGTVDARMWKNVWQAVTGNLLFAPKWAPTRWGMAYKGLTGFGMREFNPVEQKVLQQHYAGFVSRAVLYNLVVLNVLNQAFVHHWTWQNEERHRYEASLPASVNVGGTTLDLTGPSGEPQFLDLAGWVRDYVRGVGEPLTYTHGKFHPIPALGMSLLTHKDVTGAPMTPELAVRRGAELALPGSLELQPGTISSVQDIARGNGITSKDEQQMILDFLQNLTGMRLTESSHGHRRKG